MLFLRIFNNDQEGEITFEAPGPIYNKTNGSFPDDIILPFSETPGQPFITIGVDLLPDKSFTIQNTTPLPPQITDKVSNAYLTTPRISNIIFTQDAITMKTIKMAPSRATLPGEPEPDMRSSPGDDIIILLGNEGPILKESVSTGGGYKNHYLGDPGKIFSFPSNASRAERGASDAEGIEKGNEERKEGIHPDAVE